MSYNAEEAVKLARDSSGSVLVVPAGAYYFGDPCYVIPDNVWDERGNKSWHGSKYVFENIEQDQMVAWHETHHGDGEFNGHDVDSGCLGLVSLSYALANDASLFIKDDKLMRNNNLGQPYVVGSVVKSDNVLSLVCHENGEFAVIDIEDRTLVFADTGYVEEDEDYDDEYDEYDEWDDEEEYD